MYLKIDIAMAQKAITSKDAFDTLALAIYLKGKYTNSILYHHSARELKAITHLGTEKIKRLIQYGERSKVFIPTDNGLRIAKLHTSKRCIRIEKGLSIKDIQKEIRKALILNKANQVYFVKNTIVKASGDGRLTKSELKVYRKFRNSMDFAVNRFDGTIRKAKLARMVNCSRTSLNAIVKDMEKDKLIKVSPSFIVCDTCRGKINTARLNEFGDEFYAVRRGNFILKQVGNTYTPIVDVR